MLDEGLQKLREQAVKAITLYCNERMMNELGLAMPPFAKEQSNELLDALDRAIENTKNDPRTAELRRLMK